MILRNSIGEWCVGLVACAAFFLFMWAYHDWWRGKTYTWATANEACALAGLYGMALAYALGPLYRLQCLSLPILRWRRPVGVIAVGFALAHVLLTFFPLSSKYGWKYFSAHWITLVLGIIAGVWLLILAALSFRQTAEKIGMATWTQIQTWGLVVLPLIVTHYVVLNKIAKWTEWFGGKDPHPGPPGTFIGAVVVVLLFLVRGVDWGMSARGSSAPRLEAGVK